MIYAIIGIVVILALFLILRDDHDYSYNKREKGPSEQQPKSQTAPKQPQYNKTATETATEPKTGQKTSDQSVKEQILGHIEQALKGVSKAAEEPLKMVGKAMDEVKDSIDRAMRESKEGWTTSQSEVDEQFQKDEEEDIELDLSFLDTIEYDEDLEEDCDTFDVAGLRYHCTVKDCGPIVGIVRPDPSNVHDPRAQAVVLANGKLIGYIPRTQLDAYEEFNAENVTCPFVGEIELERSDARLIAEIKVIIPSSREFVEEEIEEGL